MKRTNETIIIENFPDYGKAIADPMKKSRLGDSSFGLCLDGKWHNIDHNVETLLKRKAPKLYAKLKELRVWDVYGIRYELDYEPHAKALSHHCNLDYYHDAKRQGKQNIILDYNDYKEENNG